jgi:hypothetical protein
MTLSAPWNDGTVRGLLHVHTNVSDGRGSAEQVAAAAARSGLQFVVLTDHGDGTRPPSAPTYLSGVLIVDGVEISTTGGHYVAVGLPRAPYPLGGAPADVVEDVRRLGGFGIVSHPDSPKPELRWSDWSAPIDGVEIINPDTSWRVRALSGGIGSKTVLLRTLAGYPVRPAESIALLLTDTTEVRESWMRAAADRPVVAVAGADAHGMLAIGDRDPGDGGYAFPIPSYEASLSSLSVHVRVEAAFSGDAVHDADMLLRGLRAGDVFVAVDGWASPAAFELSATSGGRTVRQGGTLPAGEPMTLRVRSNAPAGSRTTIWNGPDVVAERADTEFDLTLDGKPGVYSLEIRPGGGRAAPGWLFSNPIYVASTSKPVAPKPRPPSRSIRSLFDGRSTAGWTRENDSTSMSDVDVAALIDGGRIRLRYGLSGGRAIGQYAAAAVETAGGVERAEGVSFRGRADGPMRVSVQIRATAGARAPERWQRSVYVDGDEREHLVRFSEMMSVGVTMATPPLANVDAVMFVVDTTNSMPGASGQLWLRDVRLVGE